MLLLLLLLLLTPVGFLLFLLLLFPPRNASLPKPVPGTMYDKPGTMYLSWVREDAADSRLYQVYWYTTDHRKRIINRMLASQLGYSLFLVSSHLSFSPFLSPPPYSPIVVTQIRGNIVGASSPPPTCSVPVLHACEGPWPYDDGDAWA